jgi:hypothetical protein
MEASASGAPKAPSAGAAVTADTRRSGRKAPPGGARTRMFQMRMNDLEYQRLQDHADLQGVKVADVVRQQLQLAGLLGAAEGSGTPKLPVHRLDPR